MTEGLTLLALAALCWLCMVPEGAIAEELVWTDCRDLTVEGKGFADTAAFYDRLPAKAHGVVREDVWGLSRHSAGLCVRFATDAPAVHVKWEVTSAGLAMPHMPATGMSGVDLYQRRADGGWRFVGNGRPEQVANQAVFGVAPDQELCLYLPLYNGTKAASIGVPAGKNVTPAPARGKPVVFYGTSITQGGCASRPGMAYTALVGRKLEVPVVNLGFSGNGQSEPELADLLGEIDAAAYVLDPLWNMTSEMVQERIPSFVRKLRAARPDVPILLAEDCNIHNVSPTPKGQILRDIQAALQQEDLRNLHVVSAAGMMGPDDEGTVDGCHPTDLGFMYQAEVFTKALRPILGR